MDALGNITPQLPAIPAQPSLPGAASVPKPAPQSLLTIGIPDHAAVEAQLHAAAQKQFESVRHASEQIANDNVLGDTTFALFKDAAGELITRFLNRATGKVTYIPQPQLFKMSGGSEPATLNIKA